MNNECEHELDISTVTEENYEYEVCLSCQGTYSWIDVKCLHCGEIGRISQSNCTCMVQWRDVPNLSKTSKPACRECGSETNLHQNRFDKQYDCGACLQEALDMVEFDTQDSL